MEQLFYFRDVEKSELYGCKMGVLVNSFGSINVDAELITLANGCACCSIRTDLMQAVVKMAIKTNPPEHIVIEASSEADPRGCTVAFWSGNFASGCWWIKLIQS